MKNNSSLDNGHINPTVLSRESSSFNIVEILTIIANIIMLLGAFFNSFNTGSKSEYAPSGAGAIEGGMILIFFLIAGVSLLFTYEWKHLITNPDPASKYDNVPEWLIVLNILLSFGFCLLFLITLFYIFFHFETSEWLLSSISAFVVTVMGPIQLAYSIHVYKISHQLKLQILREKTLK